MHDLKSTYPNYEMEIPVSNWTRLERFLLWGDDSGIYRVAALNFNMEGAGAVIESLGQDAPRAVNAIVEISASGRAPRNNPALFALAIAVSPGFADPCANRLALGALPLVARSGRHICAFASYVEQLRGWGRGLRGAVADWYLAKPVEELARRMLKHPRSHGWAHRDLLRLSHPKAATPEHNALFRWAVDGALDRVSAPALKQVYGYELLRAAASEEQAAHLIDDYRLSYEMVPRAWKNSARVWEVLLERMPYGAMLRSLGRLTAAGLLAPHSPATALVVARLMDRNRIRNAHVHPLGLLAALCAYRQGRGAPPNRHILNALEEAFSVALDSVTPSGRRVYIAVDGGSLDSSHCYGAPQVPAATAAAAMAMAFARCERVCLLAGLGEHASPFSIAPTDKLDAVCAQLPNARVVVDPAIVFEDALTRRFKADAFVIFTGDSGLHANPRLMSALASYRSATGIPAKLVVVVMPARGLTGAGAGDPLHLTIAGFDPTVPAVIGDFLKDQLG